MEEPIIRSAESQLRDFLEGSVWRDIKAQMEYMQANMLNAFADCREIDEIHRMQGRLEVLRDMMIFIPELLDALKDDKDREEKTT